MAKPTVDEDEQWKALGEFIRSQRRLADLSLRQLADLAMVSNPYLSQVERGLYRPSAQVLKGIASALDISAETLFTQAGFLAGEAPATEGGPPAVEEAIRLDKRLTHAQKQALIQVYRGFITEA
jgi:transcriptional regulator with XRE-family HTH domain